MRRKICWSTKPRITMHYSRVIKKKSWPSKNWRKRLISLIGGWLTQKCKMINLILKKDLLINNRKFREG